MISTQSELRTSANVIRYEISEGANTHARVGSQLVNEVDTMFNMYGKLTKQGNNSVLYEIYGYDYQDVKLQVMKWNRRQRCWKFVSGKGLANVVTDKYVDLDAAKTAKPRMDMPSQNGVLVYDYGVSTLKNEMMKLRTVDHFTHPFGRHGEPTRYIWYNVERAGAYFNQITGEMGERHYCSPRYALALVVGGRVISNIMSVKIGYEPNSGEIIIKNV